MAKKKRQLLITRIIQLGMQKFIVQLVRANEF